MRPRQFAAVLRRSRGILRAISPITYPMPDIGYKANLVEYLTIAGDRAFDAAASTTPSASSSTRWLIPAQPISLVEPQYSNGGNGTAQRGPLG